jgi:hypothetical protein
MYPGTHTVSSAPVTSTVPFNMLGTVKMSPSRYTSNSSVYISSSSAQDIFQISNGSTDLYGGCFSGLRFDKGPITRAALYTSNVSGMRLNHCSMNWNAGLYELRYLAWATGTSGHKVSDWVCDKNFVTRQSYLRLTGPCTFHNWFIGADIGAGDRLSGGAVDTEWVWADSTCYGMVVAAGSYEFGAGSTISQEGAEGAWAFEGPTYQSRFYANFGEAFHHNTGNCKVRLDDFRASYVSFTMGSTTGVGRLKVNGSYYNAAYDTTNTSPLKNSRVVVSAGAAW